MPLTDIKIKKAKPTEKNYKLADGEGLFVLVKTNGSKLWRMKYRYRGKEATDSFTLFRKGSWISHRGSKSLAMKVSCYALSTFTTLAG